MPGFETAHIDTCTVYRLPGRDWFYLLGPQNCQTQNLAFGLAEFPAGTLAASHVHDAEEEIIYILSGTGAIISAGVETRLEPGLPSLFHPVSRIKFESIASSPYGW